MKKEIMKRLTIVLNALNNTSVSGKTNLANLSGSIVMLEEVSSMLNDVEFIEQSEKSNEE